MGIVPVANYAMKRALYEYDIYPKVFLTGRHTLTYKPLGMHVAFNPDVEYVVMVKEAEVAEENRYPGSNGCQTFKVKPSQDGCLHITADFAREQMYLVQVHRTREDGSLERFTDMRVYALNHDMKGRYPFRGDLHMHTCRSDGHESPFVVAANYRGHGYDFTVISDHRRYYPSLETREKLRIVDNGGHETSDLTDFLVVPGEEVHLPENDVHYVNFGGRFSINALVTPNCNQEPGDDIKYRSLDGNAPAPITKEEYLAIIHENAKKVPLALESERVSFAAAEWIHEQQKKAGGIGIFPHPYWLCSTMQLSETYLKFFYKNHPFDVFEVLGGESYYQHNGFQTAFYYEQKAQGIEYPVVGSTDSHGSTEYNRNALICSTLVFSPANTTADLCASILDKYSVAVDSISPELRLVGDFRWVKFGTFLLEEYFPLHDLVTKCEGYYLKEFVNGDSDAERVLLALKGGVPKLLNKYFEMN